MNEHVTTIDNIKKFTDQCFDRDNDIATRIIKGILDARSPRISDISNNMYAESEVEDGVKSEVEYEVKSDANYKAIQRFLSANDPRDNLHRLFNEDSSIVIGDPTEIERTQAKKTEYVGKVGEDKKLGFWLLVLSSPYRGRAIPFNFIAYSSKTINDDVTSRNLEHKRVIGELKELLGDRPLVLDREFSYEDLFTDMVSDGIKFVIRLKAGNNPTIINESGEKISLLLSPGKTECHRGVYYKGKVMVNLIGKWDKGFSEPMWVISNLPPEEALEIYSFRMKIDESFRDMKSLLNVDKIMNKKRENMEKMIALVLLAYSIGFLLGEGIRDRMYEGKKWHRYSGLFILLKQRIQLDKKVIAEVIDNVYLLFMRVIWGNVRTHV
jgi:hypothetical protein